jgi:NTE family protein
MTRIALALGAGGARGLAHIHALRAFDDLGVRPCAISGTSIGAVIGAAYAAGMSGADIDAFVRRSFTDRMQLVTKMMKIRPDSVASFFADGGLRLGELNLETILSEFLPPEVPDSFAGLRIPLQVVATDYYGEKMVVFASGPLRSAIAASAAIPAVFLPVKHEGRFYIDGGATNPCPIDCVAGLADTVIGVDVSGGTARARDERPGKIEALYGFNQLLQQTVVNWMARAYPNAVILRPAVSAYGVMDFLKVAEILDNTADLRERVKAELGQMLG